MERYVLRDMMDDRPLAIVVAFSDKMNWLNLQRWILDIVESYDGNEFDLIYDYVFYELNRSPYVKIYDLDANHLGEGSYKDLPSLLF